MAPSCKTSSEDSTANSGRKRFQCRHCPKSFNNGHALDGHQNAHRGFDKGFMKSLKQVILATYREQFPGNPSSPSVAAAAKLLPSAEVLAGLGVVKPGRLTEPELPGGGRIDFLTQWKPVCTGPIVPVEIEETLDLEHKLGS
ncbi:hypothetical protein ACLB2K_063487 [Fragaria x ananassa]